MPQLFFLYKETKTVSRELDLRLKSMPSDQQNQLNDD